MKLDIVPVGNSQKKLQIVVPAAAVTAEFDQVYRRIGRTTRMQGFRPGKAPRRVLEMRFKDQVSDEVAGNLIQRGYTDALKNHGVEPVGRPAVESDPIVSSKDFEFSITVDVKPEIELASYKGVDVYFPAVEVNDEEVDQLVERRLEGSAKLAEVTDRAVQIGDLALVELTAKDGDDVVASEPGTMLRTAGDPYYPGVEAIVVGLEIDGENTADVTFPEDAKTESVAGKTLTVTVKVLSIQANEVPELSDDLAEELGFEGGANGMRAALRTQLYDAREGAARNQARANALQALIDANEFDVPGGLIDQQLEALVQELRLQAAYRGQDPRSVTFNDAQMADLRIRARFAAKGALILEYVTKKESLEVADADVNTRLQELADERGQSVEALRGYLMREEGAEADFKARLLEEKCLDFLLESANLTDVAPEPVASAPAAEESAPAEQPAQAETPAAKADESGASGDADLSVLSGSVAAVKEALASGDHDGMLDALLAAEEGGKARKGAIAAIKSRMS